MSNQGMDRTGRITYYLDIFRDVRMAWKLFWDRRVPAATKLIPFLSLAYVLFPIDLVPDLALGIGQLDDLAILVLGLKWFVQAASPRAKDSKVWPRSEGTQGQPASDEVIDSTYRVIEQHPVRPEGAPTKKL